MQATIDAIDALVHGTMSSLNNDGDVTESTGESTDMDYEPATGSESEELTREAFLERLLADDDDEEGEEEDDEDDEDGEDTFPFFLP